MLIASVVRMYLPTLPLYEHFALCYLLPDGYYLLGTKSIEHFSNAFSCRKRLVAIELH